MIGIWPEAWLRLHERERTLDLDRRRVIAATTGIAPAAAAPVVGVAVVGASVGRTPDLACC